MTRDQWIARIDTVADAHRRKLVGDPLKAFEYQAAEAAAVAYRDAGFVGDVPQCVQSWAEARGWVPQAAAEDILAEAELTRAALEQIRDIRLKAKYQVLEAETDEEVEELYTAAIVAIKAVGST